MAIEYADSAIVESGQLNTGGGTVTVDISALSWSPGDVAVVFWTVNGNFSNTGPAGWTRFVSAPDEPDLNAYHRRLEAGDSSWDFTYPSALNVYGYNVSVAVFSGVTTDGYTAELLAQSDNAEASGTVSWDAADYTPTGGDAIYVAYVGTGRFDSPPAFALDAGASDASATLLFEMQQGSSAFFSIDDLSVAAISWSAGTATMTGVFYTSTPAQYSEAVFSISQPVPEPDPDSGWWIEVWDLDNQSKLMDDWVPAVNCQFERVFNDIGSGSLTVPASWSRISELCDPPNDTSTLLKVYIDDVFRYAFRADQVERTYDELGNSVVRVFGPGFEAIVDDGDIPAKDYPANPSVNSSWDYGATSTVATFDFEEGPNAIADTEPSSESAATSWKPRGAITSQSWSTAEANTGSYSILVDPGSSHHRGVTRKVTGLYGGQTYNFSTKVKGVTTGLRITGGLGPVSSGYTINSTNSFVYNGEVLSELDNVARNGSGNGCPGGSVDGTWQDIDVDVTLGSSQTSFEVFVQADHHPVCTGSGQSDFYLDDYSVTGFGINLGDWTPQQLSTFEISSEQANGGSYSLKVGSNAVDAGHWAAVALDIDAGVPVSVTSHIYDSSGVWNWRAVDSAAGTVIATGTATSGTAAFEENTFTFTAVGTGGVRLDFYTTSESATAYVDDITISQGDGAASIGAIVNDILVATQAQSNATALTDSFTDTTDSDGVAWSPTSIGITIDDGPPFGRLLDRAAGLGYEWEVSPTGGWGAGNETGYELGLYNSGALGTDYTGLSTAPTIRQGSILFGGRSRQHVAKNVVRVNVADGYWAEATDASSVAAVGRRVEVIDNQQAAGTATAQKLADARLLVHQDQARQLWVNATEDSEFRPFLDYNIGDTIKVEMDEPLGVSGWFRVFNIRCDLTGEGNEIAYIVDLRPDN